MVMAWSKTVCIFEVNSILPSASSIILNYLTPFSLRASFWIRNVSVSPMNVLILSMTTALYVAENKMCCGVTLSLRRFLKVTSKLLRISS